MWRSNLLKADVMVFEVSDELASVFDPFDASGRGQAPFLLRNKKRLDPILVRSSDDGGRYPLARVAEEAACRRAETLLGGRYRHRPPSVRRTSACPRYG
jgi:hypothetical protein